MDPSFTHYLVIDLEATCDDGGAVPRDQMETIEIGAVLCDFTSLAPVRELQTFVKARAPPGADAVLYPPDDDPQADVEGAPRLPEALAQLDAFCAGTRPLFSSWGRTMGQARA